MKTFKQTIFLPVVLNGVSNAVDLSSLFGPSFIWLQLNGTFVGTYKPQVSADGKTWVDGTLFFYDLSTQVQLAADLAADESLYTKENLPFLRFKCTAFTSADAVDTPRVTIMGQDSRSE